MITCHLSPKKCGGEGERRGGTITREKTKTGRGKAGDPSEKVSQMEKPENGECQDASQKRRRASEQNAGKGGSERSEVAGKERRGRKGGEKGFGCTNITPSEEKRSAVQTTYDYKERGVSTQKKGEKGKPKHNESYHAKVADFQLVEGRRCVRNQNLCVGPPPNLTEEIEI